MAALDGDTASTAVLATLCDCEALLSSGELTVLADAGKALPQLAPGVRHWSRDDLAGLAAAVTACSAHLKQLCIGPGDAGGLGSAADAAAAASSSPEEEAAMLQVAAVRLGILQALSLVANSDERAAAMVSAGVADAAVRDVLDCPTTNFDLNAVRAGCELLRNLCIPAATTARCMLQAGAVPALLTAAIAKARDQNGAAAAAAAVRLLLEKADGGGGQAESLAPALAFEWAPFAALILNMALDKTHPFVRVELARGWALATPHLVARCIAAPSEAGDGAAEAETEVLKALALLGSRAGVEYVAFLLASQQPELHAVAATALLALRRAAGGLAPGSAVCLRGLSSRADLNGSAGTVTGLDSASGRFVVNLSDGQEFKLKITNLVAHGVGQDGGTALLESDPLEVGALVAETTQLRIRLEQLVAAIASATTTKNSGIVALDGLLRMLLAP